MAVVTKSDAVKRLSEATGTSQKEAEAHLQAFLNLVREVLHNSDELRFVGFGSFTVQDVAAREGRNPQTGEPLHIPATRRVKFSAGKDLDAAVVPPPPPTPAPAPAKKAKK
jgi:DNA-binding protein HU-beta